MNASNVHVRSDDHLTTVVGVDDVIVVTTQDAVLVLRFSGGRPLLDIVAMRRVEQPARRLVS